MGELQAREHQDQDQDRERAVPPSEFAVALVAEVPALRRVVAAVVADRRLREEVLQDTLLRAWCSWRSFDPARPMLPWLRRLAVVSVAVRDRHARAAADAEVSASSQPQAVPVPGCDEHVSALDRCDDLRTALRRLSARERELLWARDVEELPYPVLAAMAGATDIGVRAAVSRARRRLRSHLGGPDGADRLVGAAAFARWRARAVGWAEALLHRFLPVASVPAAVVVVAAALGPAAVVVRAGGAVVTLPAPMEGRPAGVGPLAPAGADRGAAPGTPPSPGTVPHRPGGGGAGSAPTAFRVGPAGAGADVGVSRETPATDAAWYQGVEVRCDRSAVLAAGCVLLRATPVGEGLSVPPPATGPGS